MKKYLTIFLVAILVLQLLPIDLQLLRKQITQATSNNITIEEAMTWTQDNAPVVVSDTTYTFKSDLTIKEGVNIFFRNGSQIIVEGDLVIEGSSAGDVSFIGLDEGDGGNYAVYAKGEKTKIFSAIFSFGGKDECLAQLDNKFFSKVFAQECTPIAALNVYSDDVEITNSEFKHNVQSINILGNGDSTLLNANTFSHSKNSALYSKNDKLVDAQYNCWMRPSGPTHEGNQEGKGEKIVGNANYSYWNECGSDFKPVMIIPGIGGSWNWEVMFEKNALIDNWNFPPTFDGYDNLVRSFEDRGYKENRDFFIVYYDWREDNHQSMENFFKPVLEEIKEISFDEKFDVIAHSMGGLVALDYLYDESYEGEIDKVVLEGSPLLGASKTYPVWGGGEIPGDWIVMQYYVDFVKEDTESRFDYIRDHILSTKQLLPLYNHLVKNDTGEEVNVWEMQEQNDYLPYLFSKITNNQDNFSFDNILMLEGTGVDTSKMMKVDDYDGEDSDKLWKDGKPNPYPLEKDVAEGDGTVPNESSSGMPFIETKQIDGAEHTDLPTLALNEMSDFLGIERPTKEYKLASKDKLIFAFACPIDVKIISPDGEIISKNENTFEEGKAHYHSDGKSDGFKILEIRDPEFENYQIEMTGNGDGHFDAFVYKTDGETTVDTEFEGEIEENQTKNYEVAITKEGVETEEVQLDVTPPTITITSPEEKEYLNSEMVAVEYQVEDDISVVEDVVQEVWLDGEVFTGEEMALPMLPLGQHELKVTAKDEAENQAEAAVEFALTTNIKSLIKNVDYYYGQGLITKKQEKKFLKNQLRQIKWLIKHKKCVLRHFKFYAKHLRRLDRMFDRIIDKRIDWLIKHIERRTDKTIDSLAAERLVEGLEEVRGLK